MDPSRQCCCSIRYCSVVVFVASLPGLHYRLVVVVVVVSCNLHVPRNDVLPPAVSSTRARWISWSGTIDRVPFWSFRVLIGGESFYEGEIRLLDK